MNNRNHLEKKIYEGVPLMAGEPISENIFVDDNGNENRKGSLIGGGGVPY